MTALLLETDVGLDEKGVETVRNAEFGRIDVFGSGSTGQGAQPKRDTRIEVSEGSDCGVGVELEVSSGFSESADSKTGMVKEASARESA